jgi:hypothetical protein
MDRVVHAFIFRSLLVLLPMVIARTAHGSGEPPTRPSARAPFKVLYSNDATNIISCVSPYHAAHADFTDEMLCRSIDEAAGADAQLLQPGLGWVPWWKSKIYPAEEHYRYYELKYHVKPDTFGKYMLGGGDMVKTFIDHCRARGVAPFISLRMNDAHGLETVGTGSAICAHTVSRFYEDHYLQWRIGPDQKKADDHVLDWSVPQVRQFKLSLLRELCENYDFDGLELDFMRYPSYFKLDQTTPEQRRQIMTDFVRQVRQELDATMRPGRRRWLCLRVPALLAGIDRLGIDFAAMADAGADMFDLSCSYFTVQQTDVAEVRRLAPNAAIYLEMTHTPFIGPALPAGYDSFPFVRTTPEQFYTTAALAYADGADGVSLFNFAYYREHGSAGRGPFNEPPFDVLGRLADREFLARQPRWYFMAGAAMPKLLKEHWPLPRAIKPGQGLTFEPALLARAGNSRGGDGILRLRTADPMKECVWRVTVNGTPLAVTGFVGKPIDHPYDAFLGDAGNVACFACPPGLVREGKNQVMVSLEKGMGVNLVYWDLVFP